MSASSVLRLLFIGRPSTVGWLVVRVIVNAVEGHSFWPLTHVLIKGRERRSPTVTDCDATSAVVAVGNVFRVVTPLKHRPPRAKFGAVCHAMRQAVFQIADSPVGTPTGVSSAAAKIASRYQRFTSAIASAAPERLLRRSRATVLDHCEHVEPLASKVSAIVTASASSFHKSILADSDGRGNSLCSSLGDC